MLSFADPILATPGELLLNVSHFQRIVSDPVSTGDCYAIDLERVEGLRELKDALGANAIFFLNFKEDDLPAGERSQ